MAKGATVSIQVPESVVENLQASAVSLSAIGTHVANIAQLFVASKTAMQANTNATEAFRASIKSTHQAIGAYTSGALGAEQGTNQLTSALGRTAGMLRKTAIGLYVVGGAFTSIARPMIAASVIFSLWDEFDMAEKVPGVQKWAEAMKASFKSVGKAMLASLKNVGAWFAGIGAAMGRFLMKIPGVSAAVKGLTVWVNTLNVSLSVLLGWVGAVVVALGLLGWGASKLAKRFEPVSDHIQRTISVSNIAQNQFGALTDEIFRMAKRLKVFAVEDIASMVERMAYAGAIEENFRATAEMIGQIAYVTGIEMAEITRDMARLTSQTGASFHEMANVILRTFAQASITYEETVQAFQQAGMLLREDLGVNVAQMGAMVVQLEKFGYTGTRAATAVRSLAARASELKEGLRESSEIFADLGVTDAVDRFKAGEVGLMSLIKTIGDAGASYGHFVTIFNRRAGVAAAAVAEFAEEHDIATAKIQEGSEDIVEMYQELIKTQQGMAEQAEAAQDIALQRWARRLRGVAKQFSALKKVFWDLIGSLVFLVDLVGTLSNAVGTLIAAHVWPLTRIWNVQLAVVQEIIRWINMIPGVDIGAEGAIEDFRTGMMEAADQAVVGFAKGTLKSVKSLFGGAPLEVAQKQERQRRRLEKAEEDYQSALVDSIEALGEFNVALEEENLKGIISTINEQFGTMVVGLDRWNEVRSEAMDILAAQYKAGEQLDWTTVFNKLRDPIFDIINSFTMVSESASYLENKFDKVRKELDEMFGLSRSINRRQAAVVQETGETVGAVEGIDVTEAQKDMREAVGEKDFQRIQGFYGTLGGAATEFKRIIYEDLAKYGSVGIESVYAALTESLLGREISEEQLEGMAPSPETFIEYTDRVAIYGYDEIDMESYTEMDIPVKEELKVLKEIRDENKRQREAQEEGGYEGPVGVGGFMPSSYVLGEVTGTARTGYTVTLDSQIDNNFDLTIEGVTDREELENRFREMIAKLQGRLDDRDRLTVAEMEQMMQNLAEEYDLVE